MDDDSSTKSWHTPLPYISCLFKLKVLLLLALHFLCVWYEKFAVWHNTNFWKVKAKGLRLDSGCVLFLILYYLAHTFTWKVNADLSLSRSGAPELPVEFSWCWLWDVSVFEQQLLWNPRAGPHMSYSAAQRWTIRLAGEDKPVCLTFIHTPNKLIKSVVSLRLWGTNWQAEGKFRSFLGRVGEGISGCMFLFHLIPSIIAVICEECLLYKKQCIVMHGSTVTAQRERGSERREQEHPVHITRIEMYEKMMQA